MSCPVLCVLSLARLIKMDGFESRASRVAQGPRSGSARSGSTRRSRRCRSPSGSPNATRTHSGSEQLRTKYGVVASQHSLIFNSATAPPRRHRHPSAYPSPDPRTDDVPHDHGGRDARLVRTPPSRPPTTPHCDLTLARSALLSTGARPLRRRHPASRVRWLCATPVRHARPPLALSRMSFTTSTPSPPDTHVRRPHPPACAHPPRC